MGLHSGLVEADLGMPETRQTDRARVSREEANEQMERKKGKDRK